MTNTLRLDWQKEPEGFLKWMVVALMNGQDIEGLSEATNRYTDVELTILINGTPVNAGAFVEGVKRNMDAGVAREAARIVRDMDDLGLRDRVRGILDWTRDQLESMLAQHGIDVPEEDW